MFAVVYAAGLALPSLAAADGVTYVSERTRAEKHGKTLETQKRDEDKNSQADKTDSHTDRQREDGVGLRMYVRLVRIAHARVFVRTRYFISCTYI